VFLLDGLAVCCKPRQGGHELYRLKEKINLRQVKLIDQPDDNESTDAKYSLQLIEPEQLAYTFYFQKKHEKNEWMSALTHMLTKSTFDRKLDMKLKEEEQEIPQLRPHVDYRFAEDDMDENILFDEREEGKFKSSNEALIKACTIHKLIERLTYHEYGDPTLVRTFLMTYRSFCSPTKLLDLLIERFHIPMSDEVDELEAKKDPLMMKAVKAFKDNYVSPIQLRVVNVLRHWVDFHFYDFQRDQELLTRLQTFISTVKGKKMQKWVAALSRAVEKKRDEAPSAAKPVFSKKPLPVEWWLTQKPEDFNLLSVGVLYT
jgi:son of sevenless-like protein